MRIATSLLAERVERELPLRREIMPQSTANPEMLYRELGTTGEKVSAIGVGGWHLGLKKVDEKRAVRIVRAALDRGITFLDNSWDYNDGASEVRMGKALRDGYRARAFLMTKIDGRSKKAAARQLDESLKRLGVETIDLVQHHEVLRYEDPHRIFDEEGANAALTHRQRKDPCRYPTRHPVPPDCARRSLVGTLLATLSMYRRFSRLGHSRSVPVGISQSSVVGRRGTERWLAKVPFSSAWPVGPRTGPALHGP
jgi:hypothetical protein